MNVKKLHCLFPCYFLFIFYYEIVHRVQEKNEKQHKKSQSSLYAYSWTNIGKWLHSDAVADPRVVWRPLPPFGQFRVRLWALMGDRIKNVVLTAQMRQNNWERGAIGVTDN